MTAGPANIMDVQLLNKNTESLSFNILISDEHFVTVNHV